jgi:hypothetical protein
VDGPARRGSVQFLVSTFLADIITYETSGRHDRAIRCDKVQMFESSSMHACKTHGRTKRVI